MRAEWNISAPSETQSPGPSASLTAAHHSWGRFLEAALEEQVWRYHKESGMWTCNQKSGLLSKWTTLHRNDKIRCDLSHPKGWEGGEHDDTTTAWWRSSHLVPLDISELVPNHRRRQPTGRSKEERVIHRGCVPDVGCLFASEWACGTDCAWGDSCKVVPS